MNKLNPNKITIERALKNDDPSELKQIGWFYEEYFDSIYGLHAFNHSFPNIRQYIIDHELHKFSIHQKISIFDNNYNDYDLLIKLIDTSRSNEKDDLIFYAIRKSLSSPTALRDINVLLKKYDLDNLIERLKNNHRKKIIFSLSLLLDGLIQEYFPKMFHSLINECIDNTDLLSRFLTYHVYQHNDERVIQITNSINNPFFNCSILKLIQSHHAEDHYIIELYPHIENQIKDMVSYNTWSQYQAYKLITNESNPDFIMNLIDNQHESISLSDMELI